MKHVTILFALICIMATKLVAQKEPKKTKVEQQTKICEGLSPSDKPFVAIMPFKFGTSDAAGTVGSGVSDMLMNAIFGSGCFRVVERDRLNDIMKEQGMGLSGAGDEASFATVGKLLGANVLVFGTITEFKENESGGGGAGGGIFRNGRGVLGGVLGGVAAKTAHLGYTLRFINPTTGELLDMRSFDKKRTSAGVAAGTLFGGGLAAGAFYKSKSMQDALEESLIEAVTYMSQNKSVYQAVVQDSKAAVASASPQMTKENCALLKLARKPKFMIIIPEEHLAGAGSQYDPNRRQVDININSNNNDQQSGNYNEKNSGLSNGSDAINSARSFFRPPDPAGETEIMKRFLEYGLDLVDSKQLEKLRNDKDFQDAFDDINIARKIGSKFGADIVIVGEAFSEYSKAQNGMSSCRARVEIKAVMTSNAQILVADGLHGSGMDVSEVIAGKTALREAGGKAANYFLAQLCSKAEDIAALMTSSKADNSTKNFSEIQFRNVDFNRSLSLTKMLKSLEGVSNAERISFDNDIARFKVTHSGDTNNLLEKIAGAKLALKLKILNTSGNAADIEVAKTN